MPLPRRPVAPLLERLLEGKVPKQIGAELGVTSAAVTRVLLRHVKESGCKTLFEAVGKFARQTNPQNKPPEGVD